METVKKKRRRRNGKPKIENLYKVLGLRSNSRPERIKQNYIQMVKQFPPEQYPEEFERIRRAYETLRDPIKRQEYDLQRKFGGTLEETMDQIAEYVEQGDFNSAEKLLMDMLKVAPDMTGIRIGLAHLQLMKEDMNQFENQMQLLIEEATTEEEKVGFLTLKAKLLDEMDYSEEALDVLDSLSNQYPNYETLYRTVYIQVYLSLDRSDEALKLFELEMPPLDNSDPDDIFFFITWIDTMLEAEKWGLSDKIQKRVRKFLKQIQDENDRFVVTSALIDEYESYFDLGYFRGAVFYINLLYYLDPKHPFVLENRASVQELLRMEKELHRILEDQKLFPLVSFQAMTWFYDEIGHSDLVSEYKSMLPIELVQEMELMDEEYAAGIKRVQKKYPIVYRRYKNEWDRLFEEKTSRIEP